MLAPRIIMTADSKAVKRIPNLSRIIPANIRKKTKTFKKYSDPSSVPNAPEFHPRSVSKRVFKGDKTSTNMYAKNIIDANNIKAVQRNAGISLISLFTFSVINFVFIVYIIFLWRKSTIIFYCFYILLFFCFFSWYL